MAGLGLKLKFIFHSVVRSRGKVRSRLGLTFPPAGRLIFKPSIPQTEENSNVEGKWTSSSADRDVKQDSDSADKRV
jgi:hypothetical protein